MRVTRITAFVLFILAALGCTRTHAQAALLMEEPYGFFGALNPTGHNAIYFDRICAETPVELRRCQPGELGAVIARYQGINGYDWVAIPLIPYLYSVENADQVPAHVDHELVTRLRDRYHEAHLESLGPDVPQGSIVHGGWTQLIGTAYERRIYAFRFETTEAEDDALIERLNTSPNHTQFNLLFSNCADFARQILNSYFPRSFRRNIFPDAGMTTPKQIAWKLQRYGRKHPEAQVEVFEIPQVPGYRRMSHANKNIDESFVTTVYAIPITIVNPYVTGGLLVDYLFRGRYHLVPKHPDVLGPQDLTALTAPAITLTETPVRAENPASADTHPSGIVSSSPAATPVAAEDQSDPQGITAAQ
ncbi:MAG: hypothetical protein WBE38_04955 [Terracidiphilus sp.]